MKRTFTLLLSLAGVLILQAQTLDSLRNKSFEHWENNDFGAEEPVNWYTLNDLVQFGYDPSTTKSGNAHSGNYSVLLESISGPFSDIPGVLSTGNILVNGDPDLSKALVPFTSVPVGLRFWHLAFPEAGDTMVFGMFITKWNSSTGQRDTIASAGLNVTEDVTQWTEVTVLLDYAQITQPDSMAIIFSSSINSFFPTIGSRWFIDDIELIWYPIGKESAAKATSTAWPNPVMETLHINSEQHIEQISVYNQLGQELASTTHSNEKQVELDTHHWPAGLYRVLLTLENGKQETLSVVK